jgi:hypothetical protein
VLTRKLYNPQETIGFERESRFFFLGWAYFGLPELIGRTYAELDILFGQKVLARKDKSINVHPLSTSGDMGGIQMEERRKGGNG